MTDSDAFLERFGEKSKGCVEKIGMDVAINEGSNLWVVILGNNSPSSKGDSSVSGMYCSNSRDTEEGEFGHVCGTEARQVFYGVVVGVPLLLEECFTVFRVEGRLGEGHCDVNKGSFAGVFDEVNFLDHDSE